MKKENKMKEVALKGVSKSLERGAIKDSLTWPPICMLFTHQPKRPETKQK